MPEVERYDPSAIEPAIAQRWYDERTYTLRDDHPGPRYYALTMFPYPSGDLHMGHAEIFSLHDALVRHTRMTGRAVLNPFGWDAFGLPAENAAKKRGADPRSGPTPTSRSSAARSSGWATRSTGPRACTPATPSTTTGPSGSSPSCTTPAWPTARRRTSTGAPGCQTVLANEQVIDGRCERSGDVVERKPLTQWFWSITDYAQELLDGLETSTGPNASR